MISRPDTKRFLDALGGAAGRVNVRLAEVVAAQTEATASFRSALSYVLMGGGKRLRPVLCMWTHRAFGGDAADACLDVAAALECLHTYSLVHDDLPCMDDDDMRRGQPSAHRKFGEATAVLLGDALLTMCFETLAGLGERPEVDNDTVVRTIGIVAGAAGTAGLITGQVLDLESVDVEPTLEAVERIHKDKTAALIAASMEAGAALAGAGDKTLRRVREAGIQAGIAFQIVDDLLDVESNAETLGKTPGKDERGGKLTYPRVMGADSARKEAERLSLSARGEMAGLTGAGESLLDTLLEYLVSRLR